MYKSAFILFNVLTKQIKTSVEIPPQRREVIVSGDGHCLCWAVALWKDEISDEKYEEIPRSSDSLFEKNPKVFEPSNFSLNSLEDLVRKSKITGTPAETGHKFSCVSLLQRLICTYSSSQKKKFDFKQIFNARTFSLIKGKKQFRCLITLMFHDNI